MFVGTHADAATLKLNPSTGVYAVGNIFSVSVLMNTDGSSVNAADGQITFNPRELQVVSATRASSIFNLWTEEPAYSNTNGTISFGGGSPSGYKGSAGNIITITFRALGAGTPKVSFKNGSILAADGMGTNILTSMSGGTYTVSAPTDNPEPEYIAPANTPKAPNINSETHPDQSSWYREKSVTLSWNLPGDVTAVRMSLDDSESTIPTNVYDERITRKTIDDLDEGTSYFHLQFKNADGWGKVSHYKIGVDTEAPKDFTVDQKDVVDGAVVLGFSFEDVSPVRVYKIQIDGAEPIEYTDEKSSQSYTLPVLQPGHHVIVVEAIDGAGNSSVTSYTFTVEAFEKPVFIEYPTRINTEVIPAIKGTTRPNARVAIEVRRAHDGVLIQSAEADTQGDYRVVSNEQGEFTYIPEQSFEVGVYEITAVAEDENGMMSERSDSIRIIVEVPGYIAIGSMVVSFLSVLIPLIAMVLLGIFGSWYLWFRFVRWRKKIRKETAEVEESLTFEFDKIVKNLDVKVSELLTSRKGKLTKAEQALIEQIQSDLKEAKGKISAEIDDVEEIIT